MSASTFLWLDIFNETWKEFFGEQKVISQSAPLSTQTAQDVNLKELLISTYIGRGLPSRAFYDSLPLRHFQCILSQTSVRHAGTVAH